MAIDTGRPADHNERIASDRAEPSDALNRTVAMDRPRTDDMVTRHQACDEPAESQEATRRPPQRMGSCFCHSMLADRSAVSQVRRFTRTLMIEWRFGEEDVESAELIMSELSTNAINAAPGQPFGIRLSVRGGRPLLEVWDNSQEDPQEQEPDAGSEHGRGLLIVAALAEQWGRRLSGYGKWVWASL